MHIFSLLSSTSINHLSIHRVHKYRAFHPTIQLYPTASDCPTITLRHYLTITPTNYIHLHPTVHQSHHHTIKLSHYHTIQQSQNPPITLSHHPTIQLFMAVIYQHRLFLPLPHHFLGIHQHFLLTRRFLISCLS